MESDPSETLLVGWKEYLDFPEWGVRRVKVKIDTGARTSALGVICCELVEHEGQGIMARMQLNLHRRRPERSLTVEAPVLRMAMVKNSSGRCEERPTVEALIRLGPVVKRIPVTITDRSLMRHAMILGRQALAEDFVVDVSRKYLLSQRPKGGQST